MSFFPFITDRIVPAHPVRRLYQHRRDPTAHSRPGDVDEIGSFTATPILQASLSLSAAVGSDLTLVQGARKRQIGSSNSFTGDVAEGRNSVSFSGERAPAYNYCSPVPPTVLPFYGGLMHAVVSNVSIQAGQFEAARKMLSEEVVPRIRKAPGFVKGY